MHIGRIFLGKTRFHTFVGPVESNLMIWQTGLPKTLIQVPQYYKSGLKLVGILSYY